MRTTPGKLTSVAHELPRLRHDHPAWHVWASAQGHLYATRSGMSALMPGASVTVDATTADGLSHAITKAEGDAGRPRTWKGADMTGETSRRRLDDPNPPSLAKVYREFGDR